MYMHTELIGGTPAHIGRTIGPTISLVLAHQPVFCAFLPLAGLAMFLLFSRAFITTLILKDIVYDFLVFLVLEESAMCLRNQINKTCISRILVGLSKHITPWS